MLKASFVIPARNGESFIEKTVEAALNQSVKSCSIEVVIVNDHSKDHTKEIALRLAEKYQEVVVFDLIDSEGVAAGRNLGTKKASGDIIFPNDADDPSFPNRVQLSLDEMNQNGSDIFYGNAMRYFIDSEKKEPRHFQPFNKEILLNINYIANGASAYYRHVFDRIGGYDERIKIGEDYDFWLRALRSGYKFSSNSNTVYQYSMHDAQVTKSGGQKKIRKRQKWNRIVRKKNKIYSVDPDLIRREAVNEVVDFYINQNYEIWFGKNSIPNKP